MALISAGQTAEHSYWLVQLPKPSESIARTMLKVRLSRSALPCGNRLRWETFAATKSIALAFLQEATQAARDWNWTGAQPERLFQAAREVVTATHAEAWAQMLAAWDGPMPRKPVLGRDEHEKHSNAQLLTEGAQVVVPPSIHPSGRAYRWLVDGVEAWTSQAVAALGRLPRLCAADVLRVAPVERAKPRPEVRTAMRAVAAMGARPDAVDLLDAHKAAGALIKALPGGRYAVRCCWDAAHSSESLSSTAIGQGVDGRWWWRCLHASCEHRTTVEVIAALGFAPRAQNAPPSRRLERMTRRVGDW